MKKKITQYLGYIIIVIIVGVYIAWGFAKIEETDKSVVEIIADSALSLTLGLSIKMLFRYQGLSNGEQDDDLAKTKNLYGSTLEKAVPHFHKLSPFTDYKNEVALKIVRTQILQSVGLKYSDYYDSDDRFVGEFVEGDHDIAIMQNEAINETLNVKITFLTPNDLTSDTEKRGKYNDPNKIGTSKDEFMKRGAVIRVLSTIAVSFIFGYYTLSMIDSFDNGELIWKIVQVATFILTGSLELYKSYTFMTGEYRQGLIKKTNYLDEMISWEAPVDTTPKNDIIEVGHPNSDDKL